MTFGKRERKCIICRTKFRPLSMAHKLCGALECGIAWAEQEGMKKARQERLKQAKERLEADREHKSKLEAIKPLSWHINRTRTACHAYIKARDFGKPCICCGEPMDWHGDLSQIHAGHWKTQGASGSTRFNEDNIFAQKAACNLYGSGNQSAMELGMVERIGRDRVEAVRAESSVLRNWTREELAELTAYFKGKLRALKAKE